MGGNNSHPAGRAVPARRPLHGLILGASGVLAGLVGVAYRIWPNEWSLIVWLVASGAAVLLGIICFFNWAPPSGLVDRNGAPVPRSGGVAGRALGLLAIALGAINAVFLAIPMLMLVRYMP